jgi:hypothetical protein
MILLQQYFIPLVPTQVAFNDCDSPSSHSTLQYYRGHISSQIKHEDSTIPLIYTMEQEFAELKKQVQVLQKELARVSGMFALGVSDFGLSVL